MKKIKIKTKIPYLVNIVKEINIQNILLPLIKGQKICIITDSNVEKLYSSFFDSIFLNKKVYKKIIDAGENSKNEKNCFDILNFLAKNHFTREDTLITFGGGVVGDLGGFVASTYMRGISLIAIPTTLLAMVDSSVGGKTAINLLDGKNLCGTFYQPKSVIICLKFLKTLPKKEVDCGLGEIAKYTFINTKINYNGINEELIFNCIKTKANIIKKDEFEQDKRKILNFGHTFGHAIEKASNFTLSHGLCVAKGIKFAIIISKNYFKINETNFSKLFEKLKKFNFDLTCDIDLNNLLEIIYSDKKCNSKGVDMILVNNNKLQVVNIPVDNINRYLK